MKRLTISLLLLVLLLVGQSFAHKHSDDDFPLSVHITAVNVEQVNGGGTYHIFTAHIDGDNKTYGLAPIYNHLGLTAPYAYFVNIGRYRGLWNKNGTLKIQLVNKGKLTHQDFKVESEVTTPTPPAPTEQAVQPPSGSAEERAKQAPSVPR